MVSIGLLGQFIGVFGQFIGLSGQFLGVLGRVSSFNWVDSSPDCLAAGAAQGAERRHEGPDQRAGAHHVAHGAQLGAAPGGPIASVSIQYYLLIIC